MQLKSLQIQGFKSFPDKTELIFGRGLTAVVGPNGSGKSNISDAVRWVLGEQSTRNLRGEKMEDVIFLGTHNRKPTGFASVSLTIDNTDRQLAVDADDVTITRRLYRSGESEYRINKTAVRLKDITELLMDTGLGRDGYSIIGKGRIEEIVSSKPGQRREIFEEAAGISKYRYRKAEAEKKLENAYENLLRLKDIMGELEGRLEPLREQSEKAGRFLELSKEKKTLEISLWARSMEQSRAQLEKQESEYLLAKNNCADIEAVLEEHQLRIQDGYEKVQELGKDLAMQIAAMNPAYLDKSDVSQDTLDKEKEIQLAMMANDPKMAAKPEKVKEGIVMGKLGKYYEENCLMQQAFVKENKVSVEKHVAAVAKEVGGEIKIKGFYRFERGEGLEKKEENFAEEIAKQLGKA